MARHSIGPHIQGRRILSPHMLAGHILCEHILPPHKLAEGILDANNSLLRTLSVPVTPNQIVGNGRQHKTILNSVRQGHCQRRLGRHHRFKVADFLAQLGRIVHPRFRSNAHQPICRSGNPA
jgi:hypothetical protein